MKGRRQGGFLIGRVHQAGGRVFTRILRRHGIRLTPPQGRVLFSLWREGAMPIAELTGRTGLSKSTLTGLLDRLERDGHLRRVRSTEDRRVILIEPTANDARSQAVFAKASEEMTKLFYDGFTDSEIDRFEADLARLLANLRRAEFSKE
jgi:DNA-binding MarR family transcriptional regulator